MSADKAAATHLRLERRGGLAGLTLSAERAVADLTAAQRQALAQVQQAAGARGGAPAPAAPGADRFRYRLQLQQADGGTQTIDLGEDDLPAPLAALLRHAP
jgi:hypothetical protein